jgi:hypothetical protein
MPGRYAKFEESSGPIASVDRYAYTAPRASLPGSAAETGKATVAPAAVSANAASGTQDRSSLVSQVRQVGGS